MINLPIYRAKKLDSDKYIIGQYIETEFNNEEYCDIGDQETIIKHCIIKDFRTVHDDYEYCNFNITEIDIATLSIHFPDMIDRRGNKIFASLQEDGKGGDLVVSKSYPFYGDAPEISDSSGKCRELNYKGLLLFSSNGCSLDYVKVSERVRGCVVGYLIEEFNKYEYEIIGIQQ